MISIIVPVYNTANYLSQCVDSIICQSYTDWELILVDDGSKDQSGMICDEYAKQDNRITVIHQSNNGVSSARNAGINLAKGEYLCFVDADDWLEPSFLDNFDIVNSDYDMYIAGWFFNTYGNSTLGVRYEAVHCHTVEEVKNEFFRQKLVKNGYPWGKLYKTSIVRDNALKYNEKMSINEDQLFVMQYILLIHSLCIIRNQSYQYRIFIETGEKLSSKLHLYDEYIENSKCFQSLLNRMKIIWCLPDNIVQILLQQFVYSTKLKAMEVLVQSNNKKGFLDECQFWKSHKIHFSNKFNRMVLLYVSSNLPLLVKWFSVKTLFGIKRFRCKYRNSEKATYCYLKSVTNYLC